MGYDVSRHKRQVFTELNSEKKRSDSVVFNDKALLYRFCMSLLNPIRRKNLSFSEDFLKDKALALSL